MKIKIALLVILSLAFALRIWAINIVPLGFTPDEASFGYDAFSILKTGKDQWGHTLPLVLESFGDFKLPVYSYLTIPSVAIFGLTKFAVRLPSAVLGTLAVLVTYLLVSELFKTYKNDNTKPTTHFTHLGLIASLLLAINPWHIMMSRGAFEANLTTFFMPLGVYLFLKGLKDNKYFIISALMFGINLFTYHSARLVTPLIIFVLFVIYKNDLKSVLAKNKKTILSLFIFLAFLLMAFLTLMQGGARRAKDITIFNGALNEASEERFIAIYQGMTERTARLFHNKYGVITKRFITNYQQYFSVNYLFLNGPAEGTYGMTPGRGVLYLFELPFLLSFFYALFKSSNKKGLIFIFAWVLLAPIPAALTQGRGYAGNRSVIMLPALNIMSAIGFLAILNFLSGLLKNKNLMFPKLAFVFIGLISFIGFFENYFILSSYKNSEAMLYGNLEVSYWLNKNADLTKEIIISKSLSEPHIYIAFANKWDPKDYQVEAAKWSRYKEERLSFLDQLDNYSLGKYKFSSIDYGTHRNQKDVLLVGKANEFPPEVRSIAKFLRPDGSVAIIVVEPFNQAYASKIN